MKNNKVKHQKTMYAYMYIFIYIYIYMEIYDKTLAHAVVEAKKSHHLPTAS